MTPRLPRVTDKDLVRVLNRKGFALHHQTGSHAVFKSEDGKRRVVVAMHAGQVIPPKTLKAILKDAGMTVEEFEEMV
ncbi:MAG: type II toxin-antitoxin system HicA family toxin [Nitrospirae bacterium]|nr:type II toxin-antitoxin system HicA family toxin [Nitrospirota bacterium]